MERESKVNVLLNEYDKKTKFYVAVDLEFSLKFIARKLKNVYMVGVFGCGRRVYDPTKHKDMLNKEDAALKYEIFDRILGPVVK